MLWRALPLLLVLSVLLFPPGARAQHIQSGGTAPAQAALLAQAVTWARYYGSLLNLQEWTITIRLDSLPPGFLANTLSHAGHRTALMALDSVALRTEEAPWRMVLHEMLHIATAHIHALAFQLAGPEPDARALVQYGFEDLVQRMAAWPVWPTPKGVKE